MTHLLHRLVVTFVLLLGLVLTGCYSVRTAAPPGSVSTFASDGEACAEIARKRVHYAFAGLLPINSNQIAVPANMRVRVVTETDVVDTILRGIGVVFTLGIYGGTQSASVEMCQPIQVAGAPGAPGAYPPPPPYAAAPPPGPSIEVHVDPAAVIDAAGAMRGARAGGGSRVPVRDTAQAMCHSSIDCASGDWCRDRGDGIKLCMGDGGNGDFCSNGTDCGRGLFCRAAGDGYKRCM